MRNVARIVLTSLLILPLVCTGTVFAKEAVWQLDEVGLRFYAVPDESCLTRSNLHDDVLARLGLASQTVLSAMETDESYLLVLASDGRQLSLCVEDAPKEITEQDVSQLDSFSRDLFLEQLRRLRGANKASWLEELPDYALCESTVTGVLQMHTLWASTLYLGKIYSLRLEIVGRDATEADRAYLCSAVSRLLRLGAAQGGSSSVLSLPEPSALTAEYATPTIEGGGVPLTLEPIYAIQGGNQLTLTGTTDPKAKLRYTVNGSASSAFSPEADGSFTILARGLKDAADNRINISARSGEQTVTAFLKVKVRRQQTPLIVNPTSGASFSDLFVVEGYTLPGSQVQITKGGVEMIVQTDETGRFSFELNTRKEGGYVFEVQATYPGWKRAEVKGKIRRESETSATKSAKKIKYQSLLEAPQKFADTKVLYEGKVFDLAYAEGKAMCLLETENGERYLLICESLRELEKNQSIRAFGTLNGTVRFYKEMKYPALQLNALIP